MRLTDGLWYANVHQDILYAQTAGRVTRGSDGIYSDGDILYAQPFPDLEPFASGWTEVDGLRLCPLVKYYLVSREIIMNARQQIIFA